MAARSRTEAFRHYGAALQRAIACFATNRFLVRSGAVSGASGGVAGRAAGGAAPVPAAFSLSLANDDVLELRDAHGTSQATLSISLHCREVQLRAPSAGWEIATLGYVYRLTAAATETATERHVAEYHWHPWVPGIAFPHLHAMDAPARTSRLHFPTGDVTLQDVVALAMRDFGVRANRAGWERRVGEADSVLRASMDLARAVGLAQGE